MSKINIETVVILDNGIATQTKSFKGKNMEYKAYKYILKQLDYRCILHSFKKSDYKNSSMLYFDEFMEELNKVTRGYNTEFYWFSDTI